MFSNMSFHFKLFDTVPNNWMKWIIWCQYNINSTWIQSHANQNLFVGKVLMFIFLLLVLFVIYVWNSKVNLVIYFFESQWYHRMETICKFSILDGSEKKQSLFIIIVDYKTKIQRETQVFHFFDFCHYIERAEINQYFSSYLSITSWLYIFLCLFYNYLNV